MTPKRQGEVFVAWLHPQRVEAVFAESMLGMLAYDFLRQGEGKSRQIAGMLGYEAGVNIATPRNEVVEDFLAHPERGDWLLSIDVDMQFPPDAVERLLDAADPDTAPIVGGLCFGAHTDGVLWPTMYEITELDEGPVFVRYTNFPLTPPLLRVGGTGAAFLLVHRRVFEAIRGYRGSNGRPFSEHFRWFQETELSAGPLGEDLTFCLRAGICGFPVHVLTSLHIAHLKPAGLTAYRYFKQEGRVVEPTDVSPGDEGDRSRAATRRPLPTGSGIGVPPPAAEETAVIVPVLRRPQNAAPFMRSLRASTGLATVYAIADEDDPATIAAWRAAGAEVIVDNLRTYAKKANLGYRKTSQPWLFVTGDDVTFQPDWLDQAQHVAAVHNADVVGTNDLGNPRVMRGEHATHMLIRRSYVDSVGASWDGPGVVAHEGYRHWGPDDEIVTAAKQRGVWQMALSSLVVHNHPMWGRGEDDEVYRLGQSHAEQDLALLRSRLETYAQAPETSAPVKMGRYDFLAALHAKLKPRGYVEIGVQTGASLRLARCPAIGVDPEPVVRYSLPVTTKVAVAASDEFFARAEPLADLDGAPLDLAFIDGMHLCEFALRDFRNVEKYANERTVVVFDDVLPRNQAEASRVPNPGDWTGDVWKVAPILAAARPDLTLTLVDTQPTGVLLVTGLNPDAKWPELPLVVEVPDDEVPAHVLQRTYAVSAEEVLAAVTP